MDMDCIFCQISERKLESNIVFENDFIMAFLDKRPLFLGHTLIIPKMHIETYYDLPPTLLIAFTSAMQIVGMAVEKAVRAQGSFIALNNKVSQSVAHVHAHLVPRNKGDGLKGFFWPRKQFSEEQMHEVQHKIIDNIKRA